MRKKMTTRIWFRCVSSLSSISLVKHIENEKCVLSLWKLICMPAARSEMLFRLKQDNSITEWVCVCSYKSSVLLCLVHFFVICMRALRKSFDQSLKKLVMGMKLCHAMEWTASFSWSLCVYSVVSFVRSLFFRLNLKIFDDHT